MTQKAKPEAKSNAVVPVVLFGVDEHGKPKAARFIEKHASLASKAAEQLQLRVLAISDPKIAELAARLPAGRVHANGRGFVPYIRRDLYDKLLAAAGLSAAAGSADSGPQSLAKAGDGIARNWDELGPNHVVIAHESADEGWYEAIVVERHGDMLTLRWREFPRRFSRHRLSVGLLYPSGQHVAATSGAAAGTAAKPQPEKPGSAKGANQEPAGGSPLFPQTWQAIDVDHLVLAKDDGPGGSWWEAIAIERTGDQCKLRWRDHPRASTVVRGRFEHRLQVMQAI
jgi:hypothetical protein